MVYHSTVVHRAHTDGPCETNSMRQALTLFLFPVLRVGLLSLLCLPGLVRADISVATTIRPLQLIAEAILQDHGEVSVIVKANQSPHQFSISPSDRFALARADIVLWVGPEFENQLSSLLTQSEASLLTASELEGMTLYELSEESHLGHSIDSHLWLDSGNVLRLASELTTLAAQLDSSNATDYRNNLASFKASIDNTVMTISEWLPGSPPSTELSTSQNPMSFVVYHNAFQYFEKEFGLEHEFELVRDPENQPSIQEIIETRNLFASQRPECLFVEPDANMELVSTLLGDYEIETFVVDPLGYSLDNGANDYASFLQSVALPFKNCLSGVQQ
ncbi:MAG: zinc ABC transporter solute-binding protein [Gammaproteobacteria bacterium]|jgi:zinc transport system substrate-binding protein|nr:zinc ABC transporter solute-binding protein [Gammaproteobacteria bacterium]MBT3861109.1 zinc ABC transporter solute-binding protein [Gammaproteobacteria bacterium]MBT4657933.1 zinc ABC transporter solute-binding protein [Gammaproteobacteria bacterium]MBT5173551.1 zinc ABC transporter solute-binding protein [Gammaproteobacteria bacterium]MBT5742536.1 zinc ABC transporter solute-binding protein [Gammaproteobacteria bacterium]